MSEKLMSIVILNWNRLSYTKKTIKNIIQKTTIPHILTLVDNNSTEESGMRDYLKSITKSNTNARDVLYVFNKKNLGVAGGRNSGIWAVEQKGYSPAYIFNIDDDIVVPAGYDIAMKEICDKVPRVGLTGINVEPNKYPIIEMNSVRVQLKSLGNLGGAALCLPRRVFSRVGYYGFGKCTLYGHEDSYMRYKLDILKLLSAYIPQRGVHLDNDSKKTYRKAKNMAHKKGSIQLRELSANIVQMRQTGNIYTPYTQPEDFYPVDEDIFTNDILNDK